MIIKGTSTLQFCYLVYFIVYPFFFFFVFYRTLETLYRFYV